MDTKLPPELPVFLLKALRTRLTVNGGVYFLRCRGAMSRSIEKGGKKALFFAQRQALHIYAGLSENFSVLQFFGHC